MAGLSISGAVTGLDTASIVDQLVQVEGRQQQMIQSRQTTAQKTSDAYSSLITSLKTVAEKAKAIAKTSSWVGSTATSSSTNVKATATGTVSASLTFDVTALAATHTLVSDDTVSSTGAVVASGPLTFTKADGTTKSISVGAGSLGEVVSAINSSGTGLRAAAVQVAPGSYRLQVAAGTSGTASSFTLAGLDGFSGVSVLTQAADAQVTMGSGPSAYTVTSSSNTFSGIAPGLDFTVSKLENGVTVEASLDGGKVADDIDALVKSVNDLLASVAKQTAYDSTTKTGGPLMGEPSVRALQQQILSQVGLSGAPGVDLTRDGKLTFDKTAFTTKFKADPTATARAFGANVSFTPEAGVTGTASFSRADDSTRPGTYNLKVAVSAAREQWKMDPPGGIISGQTVVLMRGSTVVSYTAGAGDTLADVVAAVNARSVGKLGVSAAVNGGSIVLTALGAGAAQSFTTEWGGVAGTQLVAGADVQGEIDGQTAVGSGDQLTLAKGTGGAVGLSIRTSFTDADVTATSGDVGSITYDQGLAQRLVSLVDRATNKTDGSLVTAKAGRDADVKDLQDQSDAWTRRLEDKRSQLMRQFTAMETAISSLKNKASALGGLSTMSY
ncbi:MAG: flagellar filament capping protein FliD [Kineosporiaceae bacterium]